MAHKESSVIVQSVEYVDGAEKKIEVIPTIGMLSGLSGKNQESLPPLWERGFERIYAGKFDKAFESCKPRVNFTVPDPISKESGKNMLVDIEFKSLQDFEPEAVANAVEPLRKLLEARDTLRQFKTKLDGRFKLQELVNKALKDPVLAKLLTAKHQQ